MIHPTSALLGLALAATTVAVPTVASAATTTARLVPDAIAVGETARLAVSTDDPTAATPVVPDVPGLSIRPAGQSTQVSIVNGATTQRTSYLYALTAARAGRFVLQGIRSGGSIATPVTLQVTASHAAGHGSAALPATAATSATSASGRAFLRLEIPKKRLYAGEAVPVTVRGFFRGGMNVTLTGPPQMTTDAFTIAGLDAQPAQARTAIGGQEYLVVTWHGLLTAVKAGAHDLRVELPATVEYVESSPTAAPSGADPQSLIDQFMNGADPEDLFAALDDPRALGGWFDTGHVVSRDLVLTAGHGKTSVADLPAAGRPAGFTGAVGHFEVSSALDRTKLVAGEPATLTVTVTGQGNFAAVAPALAPSPAWKTYAAHATFEPGDAAGAEGRKILQQPVAARAATDRLPPVELSYFDPDTGRYASASAPAIPVEVAASADPSAVDDDPVPGPAIGPRTRDSASFRSLAEGGVPRYLEGGVAALLLGALGLALAIARRQAGARRPGVWRWRRAARRERRRLAELARRSDGTSFYPAARRLVQLRLASAWRVPPDRVTAEELAARWPGAPVALRSAFERADAAEFGAQAFSGADLTRDARRLDEALAAIPAPSTTARTSATEVSS